MIGRRRTIQALMPDREPNGCYKTVAVTGYEFEWSGLMFVVHRQLTHNRRHWAVTEPTTGRRIGDAERPQARAAIWEAVRILEGYGFERVMRAVMEECFGPAAAEPAGVSQ